MRYAPGRANPSAIKPVQTESALWLGVPFISQLDGTTYSGVNCGPASTAMVLAAFGIRTKPDLIRNYVNSISGVYSSDAGTSLDHLGRVIRESGLDVSGLYSDGGYRRWSTASLRQEVLAGHPVVTLVKYRALPGHGGSLSDFDHYIVIAGVSGNDFIYNDAAYSGGNGYGLLISPSDLERAWDYSSIPRHGMAVRLNPGAAIKLPPTGEEAEQLAEAEPESELVAESDLDLGGELQYDGAFSTLLLKRILVDGAEELEVGEQAAAPVTAALQLGGFVEYELVAPDDAALEAPLAGNLAGHSPLASQPAGSGLDLGGLLIWPLFAAMGCLIALLGRRVPGGRLGKPLQNCWAAIRPALATPWASLGSRLRLAAELLCQAFLSSSLSRRWSSSPDGPN